MITPDTLTIGPEPPTIAHLLAESGPGLNLFPNPRSRVPLAAFRAAAFWATTKHAALIREPVPDYLQHLLEKHREGIKDGKPANPNAIVSTSFLVGGDGGYLIRLWLSPRQVKGHVCHWEERGENLWPLTLIWEAPRA